MIIANCGSGFVVIYKNAEAPKYDCVVCAIPYYSSNPIKNYIIVFPPHRYFVFFFCNSLVFTCFTTIKVTLWTGVHTSIRREFLIRARLFNIHSIASTHEYTEKNIPKIKSSHYRFVGVFRFFGELF